MKKLREREKERKRGTPKARKMTIMWWLFFGIARMTTTFDAGRTNIGWLALEEAHDGIPLFVCGPERRGSSVVVVAVVDVAVDIVVINGVFVIVG
jgi:hypothetical protein